MDFASLQELIIKIKQINLRNCVHEELKDELKKLEKFAIIQTILHNGYDLVRASPNSNLYESFTTVSRISFKPQEFNKSYLRASTPFQTMFYGCSQQFDNPQKIDGIGRITALIESMPIMKNIEKGIWKITFGRWKVLKELRLVTVCHKKELISKTPDMELMYESYQKFVLENPEIKNHSLVISDFLANEFSKEIPLDESHLYKISAIFSEIIVERGFDGIMYPSVRTYGDGINIAISPKAVNTSLQCTLVGECFIFKNGEQIEVLDINENQIDLGQQSFKFPRFEKSIFDVEKYSQIVKKLDLWGEVHSLI